MHPTPPLPPGGGFASIAVEFAKRIGLILAASLGVVAVAALALGQFHPFGFSNLLFWAALVVLGIAVVPALSELGSGVTTLGRALTNRDKSVQATLAERQAQRDKWLNSSIIFGTAGVILFVFSFLVATVFAGR